MDVSVLREQNAGLRAEVESLRRENADLKERLHAEGSDVFAKSVLLLESVYGDLVGQTKQAMLQEMRREMDEASQSLLAKHERIRDEVLSIQKQGVELQERLKATAAEPREGGVVKELSAKPVDAAAPGLPIEYYLMRGNCRLEETTRSSPETPKFFKTERRPTTSFDAGFQGRRLDVVQSRPLTNSGLHREFIQRKLGPSSVQERPRRSRLGRGDGLSRYR